MLYNIKNMFYNIRKNTARLPTNRTFNPKSLYEKPVQSYNFFLIYANFRLKF